MIANFAVEGYSEAMAGLYVVATPIGNLEDITYRAVRTLSEVDFVLAEDTRHTRKLLTHFDIHAELVSCRAQNEAKVADTCIRRLQTGESAAFVSDAGTPGLSDPGAVLVEAVRQAGFEVRPVPGPSALAAVVSVGGYSGKRLCFEGFLSPKPGRRRRRLEELLTDGGAFVLYESPHRIVKFLRDLEELEPERRVLIGREMTKIHEEYLEGTATEIARRLESREQVRGEITVLVGPGKKR
ncbi:MAG: 16S rRNA (cytidine(1402)-2'-O)-methyltransferase [Spirochaetaceae bacterium]